MSIVFDYLQRRLAESGSAYWKSNTFDIRLVNKTDKEIDPSAMDYTLSNLVEVSGTNYLYKKSSNNVVIQTDTGKIVYTFDDVIWESSSVSADGVLVSNGQYPLIFIDFGYRRLSENGPFEIQWGEDGLIHLETSNETVSSTSGDTSTGIETGKNLGGGNGLYAGVNNKTINFKTLVSDKWIVINSTDEEVSLKLNQDFLVEGDNVKLEKNPDGSITINAVVKDNSNPVVVPNEIEKKLNDHIGDTVIHVTQEDKDRWNTDDVISWNDLEDKPTTVSGFGITDVYTKTEVDTAISNIDVNVEWSEINNKPTTVSGFGITDVYTKTEVDNHMTNDVIHVTQLDKDKWNTVDTDYVYYVGTVGDTAVTLTHNLNTEDYVVDYVDMESKSNLALIAEQSTNSVVIEDMSPLTMNKQLKIILRLLNKRYSGVPPILYSLLLLDVAEVSMLCVDGSDGKNNLFYLEAIFSDGNNHQSAVTWTSSDLTVAIVDSEGYVRGVSNGGATLGKDVTISCQHGGITKSCLFTVYETMPSAGVEGAGLWLCKGGSGPALGTTYANCAIFQGPVPPNAFKSARLISSYRVNSDGVYSQHIKNGATSAYLSPVFGSAEHGYSPLLSLMQGTLEKQYILSHPQLIGALAHTDIAYDSVSAFINGVQVSTVLNQSAIQSVGFLEQHWHQASRKTVFSAYHTEAGIPLFRTSAISYVPQNYIRYTDQGSYVNRTIIPNIGTLGESYNLEANNVPALWYGV